MSHNLSRRFENLFVFRFFCVLLFSFHYRLERWLDLKLDKLMGFRYFLRFPVPFLKLFFLENLIFVWLLKVSKHAHPMMWFVYDSSFLKFMFGHYKKKKVRSVVVLCDTLISGFCQKLECHNVIFWKHWWYVLIF